MNHQLMTIVVQRPSDEAQLQSYLLGLEVLWPFQIAAFAGDATGSRGCQRFEHDPANRRVKMDCTFDKLAWHEACKNMAAEANRGCGLVFEAYKRAFTRAVNCQLLNLDEGFRAEATEIAKTFGWATPEQLAQSQRLLDEDGSCSHGIDPRWCPAGCGDMEQFDGG